MKKKSAPPSRHYISDVFLISEAVSLAVFLRLVFTFGSCDFPASASRLLGSAGVHNCAPRKIVQLITELEKSSF